MTPREPDSRPSSASPRTKVLVTIGALLAAPLVAATAIHFTKARPRFQSVEEALEWSERADPDASPGPGLNLRGVVRRSSNPDLIFELKPNLHAVCRGALVETNSYGFRDRDWTMEKPLGTVRLALVGDSILFGVGLPVEKTYARLLETQLAGKVDGSRGLRLELMAFAVPGYNSYQEAALFRDRVLEFSPDIVIVGYVGNDQQPPALVADVFGLGGDAGLLSKTEWSFGVRERSQAEKRRLGREYPNRVAMERVPEPYRKMTGLSAVKDSIRAIGRLGNEKGARVLLTLYEWHSGPANDPSPRQPVHEAIGEVAREVGIECLDLHPVFTRVARERGFSDTVPLWMAPNNVHLGEEGHRVFASALAARLEELGWLGR